MVAPLCFYLGHVYHFAYSAKQVTTDDATGAALQHEQVDILYCERCGDRRTVSRGIPPVPVVPPAPPTTKTRKQAKPAGELTT